VRGDLKEKHPDMNGPEMAKLLGEKWKALPEKDQKKWNKTAKKRLDTYYEELDKYFVSARNVH
jgi:trehalose-6-phosphatase